MSQVCIGGVADPGPLQGEGGMCGVSVCVDMCVRGRREADQIGHKCVCGEGGGPNRSQVCVCVPNLLAVEGTVQQIDRTGASHPDTHLLPRPAWHPFATSLGCLLICWSTKWPPNSPTWWQTGATQAATAGACLCLPAASGWPWACAASSEQAPPDGLLSTAVLVVLGPSPPQK